MRGRRLSYRVTKRHSDLTRTRALRVLSLSRVLSWLLTPKYFLLMNNSSNAFCMYLDLSQPILKSSSPHSLVSPIVMKQQWHQFNSQDSKPCFFWLPLSSCLRITWCPSWICFGTNSACTGKILIGCVNLSFFFYSLIKDYLHVFFFYIKRKLKHFQVGVMKTDVYFPTFN